jgi:hypothetical protein
VGVQLLRHDMVVHAVPALQAEHLQEANFIQALSKLSHAFHTGTLMCGHGLTGSQNMEQGQVGHTLFQAGWLLEPASTQTWCHSFSTALALSVGLKYIRPAAIY